MNTLESILGGVDPKLAWKALVYTTFYAGLAYLPLRMSWVIASHIKQRNQQRRLEAHRAKLAAARQPTFIFE